MSVASQLLQLQEVDLQIEACERSDKNLQSQLGESPAVAEAKKRLSAEEETLAKLQKEQREINQEMDDLTAKIKANEDKMYGSTTRNPKELSGLQKDTNSLKSKTGTTGR